MKVADNLGRAIAGLSGLPVQQLLILLKARFNRAIKTLSEGNVATSVPVNHVNFITAVFLEAAASQLVEKRGGGAGFLRPVSVINR